MRPVYYQIQMFRVIRMYDTFATVLRKPTIIAFGTLGPYHTIVLLLSDSYYVLN